jgi:dephospho-CoA kinase
MSGPGASARVPFVGLTGGLGSGKSTALEALAALGAATLSTDALVHELLATREVREAIAAGLGPGVLDADGELDRAAVATRVFERPDERAWLEGLLWPLVGQRVVEWRAELEARDSPPPVAVVETPLLFEAEMQDVFDTTIAIVVDEDVRSARAAARGHAAVRERAGRQLSQEEKSRRADHTVRNDGSPEELKAELSRLLATIGI